MRIFFALTSDVDLFYLRDIMTMNCRSHTRKKELIAKEALPMAENDYRNMDDKKVLKIAKKRVFVKRGFFSHLAVYLVLTAILVIIYFTAGGGYPWFAWPVGIWAVFVIFHALSTVKTLGKIDGKATAAEKEAERLRNK